MKVFNNPSSYATAISAAWNKSVDNILEAAKLCAEADKELSASEKAELFEQLPFEAPTFSRLVKIGNDTATQRRHSFAFATLVLDYV